MEILLPKQVLIVLKATVHVDGEFSSGKIFHWINFHLVLFSPLRPLDEIQCKYTSFIRQKIFHLFNFVIEGDREKFFLGEIFQIYANHCVS